MKVRDHVELGGIEWDVINIDGDNALLLASECVKEMRFGDDANYITSVVREYLENELYEKMIEHVDKEYGVDLDNIICSVELSLVSDDGTYLSDERTIGADLFLLSAASYRTHRENIKDILVSWWLNTSLSKKDKEYARYVCSDGTLGNNIACIGDNGIRPACVINISEFEKMKSSKNNSDNSNADFVRETLTRRELLEQAAEEAAELSQALLKYIRAVGLSNNVTPLDSYDAADDVEEEFADLCLCMQLLGVEEADKKTMSKKLERWSKRLKGECV